MAGSGLNPWTARDRGRLPVHLELHGSSIRLLLTPEAQKIALAAAKLRGRLEYELNHRFLIFQLLLTELAPYLK